MSVELTIVVPARDEAARIGGTVAELRAYCAAAGVAGEVLVVDDGSADRTGPVAAAAGARVLTHPANRGKGAAVRSGMLAAAGALRLFCDADLSTPIDAFGALRDAIGRGADVAVGSRARPGAEILRPRRTRRVALSRAFNLFTRRLAPDFADTQCGFKLFTAAAAERLFARTAIDRYAFDVELLVAARELGLRVVEVPVRWSESDVSSVRLGPDGTRMLLDLARIAALRRSGRYR